MKTSTITIDVKAKRRLDQLKRHAREPYNDVVVRLIEAVAGNKPADVDAVMETAAILSDPEVLASLARSLDDLKHGRLHSIDEV